MDFVDGQSLDASATPPALDVRQRLGACSAGAVRRCTTRTSTSWCTATSSQGTSWWTRTGAPAGGLRHRAAAGERHRGAHADGRGADDARVRLARAGARRAGRHHLRRLLAGRGALRVAHRRQPLPGAAGDVGALLHAIREAEAAAQPAPPRRATDEAVACRAASRERLRRSSKATSTPSCDGAAQGPQGPLPSVQALADDLRARWRGVPPARTEQRRLPRHPLRRAATGRRWRRCVGRLPRAVGGPGATAWQARRGRAERDAGAAAASQQVRSLAHSVLFDYHDGIADLPGSTPLRERLVKDAQAYLDSLAAEAQDDASLRQRAGARVPQGGRRAGRPLRRQPGRHRRARRPATFRGARWRSRCWRPGPTIGRRAASSPPATRSWPPSPRWRGT